MEKLWEKCSVKLHEIIEKKSEPLYLSVRYDCSFSFDFYMELRKNNERNLYTLYHSTMGTRQLAQIIMQKFSHKAGINNWLEYRERIQEAVDSFDFEPYIRWQFMENSEVEMIFDTLSANKLPNHSFTHQGLDGGWFYIKSYIGGETECSYWSRPPKEHSWIVDMISIMGEYLPRKDRSTFN